MSNKPLSGIRILDLTHMLSGPYGAMILADLGADVIKVEPLEGEGTRKLLAKDPANSIDGMGAYFLTLNRNKRSVCIDLKSADGLELFYQLVEQSDIVINNFGAGVPQRLRIDHASLAARNPRIISCSVTGFGSTGPHCQRPAFDQVAQAIGGGMSITGTNAETPVRAGIPIGDLGGGAFSVMGILAALVERERSGQGQDVDISMVDCQISLLNYMATMHFLSGENPTPIGNAHFVHVPYNSYRVQDGFIIVAVITDNFWHNLKDVVNVPAFADARYDFQPGRLADKAFIDGKLAEIFATNTQAHWLAQLEAKRIPCAPVNNFGQALRDPQVLHRNMVVDLKHPNGQTTRVPGSPLKFSRTNEESYTSPPLLGQHTDEVLTSLLGMPAERVSALRAQQTIR
ncbi:MAG TPA: CoA transferase [Fontimonas sp.]